MVNNTLRFKELWIDTPDALTPFMVSGKVQEQEENVKVTAPLLYMVCQKIIQFIFVYVFLLHKRKSGCLFALKGKGDGVPGPLKMDDVIYKKTFI